LFKYIKKAFFFHWNLLAVASGVAAGIISGQADVFLPILAALEVAYLALLSSRPRFQDAVNAELHKITKGDTFSSDQRISRILTTLNKSDRTRYEQLKNLCLRLQHISRRVKRSTETNMPMMSGVHVNSINRLLWIYLKLLYSKNAMDAFFKTIDVEDIKSRIERTRKRLKAMGPENQDRESQALRRKSMKGTLNTACSRLKNYETSMENYEFIELELERLYSKIASLAEMGINRQDPNLINSEIDVVSSSIEKTEKAMSDLDFITGIPIQDEEPPTLLEDYARTDEVIRF